tara:strand:- start:4393 stop:5400 length:1008 start_codon:yes stop_codon:yes gene_type:complete
MLVFAVETSCDETSVCIIRDDKQILSHIVHSQVEHKKFGGVLPEIASRSHIEVLPLISKEAFLQANIDIEKIDVFCATCGPGLIGGLLVGSTFTKSLAIGQNKPFVPINHLEGHILSPSYNNITKYPYLCFLLTGGHTQIYLVKSINNYELLGETLDDAIGEAFDKVAKLLGMQYPGGPEIEKNASLGDKKRFALPIPLERKNTLNFSFSGIKTAVNLIVKKNKKLDKKFKLDMSSSFQETVTKILVSKLKLSIEYLNNRNISFSQISLVGGVANNQYIYNEINLTSKNNSCSLIMPPKDMLSDNAAMIGWACIQKYSINAKSDIFFKANPRLKI